MFTKAVKYQSFLKMSLSGVAGSGKAQPLDAKILTPTGWKLMGDVRVGDAIINSQGDVSHVLGVYPQGEKEIYRVTLSDGSSTECCDDHLWRTQTRLEPMVKAIEFEEQAPLALDPYVFGVLLGDGCFQERWVTLSNPELFIQDYVREHLPHGLGLSPTKSSSYEFRVSGGRMTVGNNPVVTALREDGLVGKKSTEKFIPDRYKFAGVEHRIALLQGLLDTDGYARGCSLEYSSSSPRLAQDVQFLVESLGGKAHMAEKTPHYTHRGEYRQGAPSYRLCISLPPDVAPFRLPRKASQYIPRSKYLPARSIQEVTFVGVTPAQCIAVDAPDQLYVTDHCIVTHNTWTSLTLATALADGQGVALIDTEHGSASLYADLFSFDVLELDTFHPQKFIDALVEAEQAGYAVLIIDSLSHAWNGKGGLLDVVDNIAVRKYKGNSFNAWKDAGLIQNALVEAR